MPENPTIAAYDQYHQAYDDETAEFWDRFPVAIIDRFVKNLPGKRIIDIGSGPGRDALLLKQQGLEVTCVDASEEMVKRTQDLGFVSILEDMRKLKLPKSSFDGVWVYTSLIHIPKAESAKVLKNLSRSLTENGIILVGAIEGDFDGWVKRPTMPGVKRYFKHYSEPELKNLVESAGYKFIYQKKYQPHHTVYLNQIFQKP